MQINIYDALGSVVRQLDLGHQAAGFYQSRCHAAYWDGTNRTGEPVAIGIYQRCQFKRNFTAGVFAWVFPQVERLTPDACH